MAKIDEAQLPVRDIPDSCDLLSRVEILTGWSTFSGRNGVLWLIGDRIVAGKEVASGNPEERPRVAIYFDRPVGELDWRWSRSTAELRIKTGDHRYRIKLEGWSTLSDESPLLDLAGQVSRIADNLSSGRGLLSQYLEYRDVKKTWEIWRLALERVSASRSN